MTGNVTYGKGKAVHLTVGNRGNASLCGAWKRAEETGAAKNTAEAPATCKTCLKARENGSQEKATAEVVEVATEALAADTEIAPAVTAEAPAEDKARQDEALTLHSQGGKVALMNNDASTATAETTPAFPNDNRTPVQGEQVMTALVTPENHTGSTVVSLLEKVWARIRADHPELPEVVIITGSGLVGASKWGHFRAKGWKVQNEGSALHKDELFLAGEALAKGAAQVLQTMLHEGAHTLAEIRGQQDTSRQGRWHNAIFRKLAEEMGLEHRAAKANKSHGFSFVTLTAATKEKYADLLAELDREIKLVCHLPVWLGGQDDQDGEAEGGEKITGKPQGETKTQSGPLKAVCGCEEPLIIRLSRKVLDMRVVACEACGNVFKAA